MRGVGITEVPKTIAQAGLANRNLARAKGVLTRTPYEQRLAQGNEVPEPASPSGVSSATPHGRLIAGAGNLGSQPGWRGGVGRTIAYVALAGVALAVIAVIAGVIWLAI